ncbi:MAG: hypothetical protein ABSG68_25065, partial [Thermoguttaceae bacterium]
RDPGGVWAWPGPVTAGLYRNPLPPYTTRRAAPAWAPPGRHLLRLSRRVQSPWIFRRYAHNVAAFAAVLLVLVGSGATLWPTQMTAFVVPNYGPIDLRFLTLKGPAEFLGEHVRDGDVVLSDLPQVVDHFLAGAWHVPMDNKRTDYWLQTTLYLQAALNDRQPVPLHRLQGTTMIANLEGIEDLFARSGRIWCVCVPKLIVHQNERQASAYLRQNMRVVYEDFSSMVLVRDGHWPAEQRRAAEKALFNAHTNFLP